VEVELLGTDGSHDDIENTELSSGKSTDHDPSGDKSDSAESVHTFLSGDVLESCEHTSGATSSSLVDLGEEGISGVRDGGSDDTSNNTRLERYNDVLSFGELLGGLSLSLVDHLSSLTLNSELSHGVRNLFAENGDESRVEATDETVFSHDSLGTLTHTVSIVGLRDKSDSAGFIRAKEDISDSFSHSGRGKVDLLSVVPGFLVTHGVDESSLEVFDSTELEPSLDEVSLHGGSETSEEGTSTFVGNDVSGSRNETGVDLGVKLDSGLNNINGGDTTVSKRAADTTSKGTLKEVFSIEGSLTHNFTIA